MARTIENGGRGDSDRRGIQSIEIGVRVLSALAKAGGPSTLKLIGEISEMSPSKAHRYLSSFTRTGLARQDPASGLYDLGPLALTIGLAALSRIDLVQQASEAMLALTEETQITSLLTIWSEQGAVIIRWQRTRRPFVTSLSLGSTLPVLGSATGNIFLAYLPRRLTEGTLDAERADARGRGAKRWSESAIKSLISDVRSKGWATVQGSLIPGLQALSAPILDAQGEAAAAITLIGGDEAQLAHNQPSGIALLRTCRALSFDATGSR